MNLSLLLLSSVTIVLCLPISIGGQLLVCPPEDKILPCTCFINEMYNSSHIECMRKDDSFVIQDTLFEVISVLREVNNLSPEEWLPITFFLAAYTSITQLDLTPFLGCDIGTLRMSVNNFTEILIPPRDTWPSQLNIKVRALQIDYNYLTDEVIESLFSSQIFDPTSLELLWLSLNYIEGSRMNLTDGSGDIEFLDGLSSYTNLNELDLGGMFVELELSGGQFKRNLNLNRIILSGNEKLKLGSDALLVGREGVSEDEKRDEENVLYVNLLGCQLNDQSFEGGWWFPRGRPTYIDMLFNYFEFITEEKFGPYFLEGHPENMIDFGDNLWICDERMKWLKDLKDQLENRSINMFCSNDPGQTVFTTRLIS